MADLTVPRLPKLAGLTKLQALLLLGGAFVFGMLSWILLKYVTVIDRTAAAPEDAVLAATIFDRGSEDWQSFESTLPERVRQALSMSGDASSVTIFAVPGAGEELEWGLVEALSSVNERAGRTRIRLVPKGTSAVGRIMIGGREVPFEAQVSRGLFQARFGRDFLGLTLDPNPFTKGRRYLAPIQMQSAYLEKPSGVSWQRAIGLLGERLQRFQPQAGLWSLPGRLELSVSATDTHELGAFVLYYRPDYGRSLAGPELEDYAKALLAESEPVGFKVLLPDDSEMVELRLEPDAVQTERKKVNLFGERAQLKVPGGSQKMEIFYADVGETWLSNDLGLIQASILGNIRSEKATGDCEVGGKHGFASFTGPSLKELPYLGGFERLTVSIHNIESGMFTTCGYFTP